MPARLAARFECDEILMPQLVDDLPRRDAALSRRAGDEHMTARPRGEVASGPASADRSAAGTAVSSDGLSIDGTMPKM